MNIKKESSLKKALNFWEGRKGFCAYAYGALLVLLVLYTLLFSGFTNWTPAALSHTASIGRWVQIAWYALVVVCVLLEMLNCWQRALLAAILLALRWRAPITFQSGMVLDTVLMAALSDLGTEQSNRNSFLISHGAYLLLLAAMLLVGAVRDATTTSNKTVIVFRLGHSLGMLHPNSLAAFLMSAWLLAWIMLKPKKLWITAALFAVGAVIVLALTLCRTVALLMILFPVLYAAIRGIGRSRRPAWLKASAALPLLALCLTILLGVMTSRFSQYFRDGAFWLRFSELRILQKDGLTLFGARPSELAYFDNVYLWMLMYCGIVTTLGVLAMAGVMLLKLACEKRMELLSVGALFVLYGLMENTAIYLVYCFIPILTFAAGKRDHKQNHAVIL